MRERGRGRRGREEKGEGGEGEGGEGVGGDGYVVIFNLKRINVGESGERK